MKQFFYFMFLFFIACASPSQSEEKRFQDPADLVIPYSIDLEKNRPMDPPYRAEYTRNSKTLVYVAATHTSVDGNSNFFEHPTIKMIQHLFNTRTFDAVIVEGISSWGVGTIPEAMLKHAAYCESTQYKENCGEPWYTITQASKHNASIFTGEPTDKAILSALIKQGYTAEDLLGFYIARGIPVWKKEGTLTGTTAKTIIDSHLVMYKKLLSLNSNFGFDDFEKWYRKHVHFPKNYISIEFNDVAPIAGVNATYIQRISNAAGVARDQSVVRTIAKVLEEKSNVLVVYGASHFLVEKPALDFLLGQAVYRNSSKLLN